MGVWTVVALLAVALVATGQEAEEYEGDVDHRLKSIRRLMDQLRERSERADSGRDAKPMDVTEYELGIEDALPMPLPVKPPEPRTVAFAWPLGVAWLAAWQCADGSWPCDPPASDLATLLFASGDFEGREGCVAQLRIFLSHLRAQPDRIAPEPEEGRSPRECALRLLSSIAVGGLHTNDRTRHERDICRASLEIARTPTGWGDAKRASDPITTAWAIVALRAARQGDPEAPAIEGSSMELPTRESPGIIASLLLRGSEAYRLDHAEVADLAALLAADATTRKDRSLEEWYLGALALRANHPDAWEAWRTAMLKSVLRGQELDGSWSEGETPDHGGRIGATALALLCLRVARTPER